MTTISIHDYPEHLNPFHEEDNHNKIRFWTIGRKRSNSMNFTGIKDLKNSWSLRSFMKKGKKSDSTPQTTFTSSYVSSPTKRSSQVNGDSSPIVFRRAMQYSSMSRSTISSPGTDRYVYGGSITPLPRSRFQERLRSSHQDVNISPSATPRMARSDIMGSRLSVISTNPFDEPPIPPVRASKRKKNRAPPPPPASCDAADDSISSLGSELRITEAENKKGVGVDDLDEFKVELKIVEDEDQSVTESKVSPIVVDTKEIEPADEPSPNNNNETTNTEEEGGHTSETLLIVKKSDSEDDILKKVSFPKVNINRYRRNSSINEDDVRLRRGNLEDYNLSNKRSKSLTNTIDGSYAVYDINLNDNNIDENSNEEPQKVICKVYEDRKQSVDNSVSSTEKEFIEIDKATRELEREISKLNSALNDDDISINEGRLSVSDIKRKFDRSEMSSPNPIPKPRRSHYGGSSSPINNNREP